jgi:hypothetical protein
MFIHISEQMQSEHSYRSTSWHFHSIQLSRVEHVTDEAQHRIIKMMTATTQYQQLETIDFDISQ